MSRPPRDPARRRRILEEMRVVSYRQQRRLFDAGDIDGWLSAAVRTGRIDELLAELGEAGR
ncbi:MAG TPA: hypothetical protein VN033_10220 [Vulgatibacter sp.]|nr:hypothetical protein [Vulgatibacter sp.]